VKLRSFTEETHADGKVTYIPSFTCAHCNTIVEVKSKDQDMGFCQMCFYPVCLVCGAKDTCDPFEKKLERIEARARFLNQV
jgi:hypothetical protein